MADASIANGSEPEEVMALKGIMKNRTFMEDVYQLQKRRAAARHPADRWLDENEREWKMLDRLMCSRPWALRKDEPFPYPFRKAVEEMRTKEGPWLGDDNYRSVAYTRDDVCGDIVEQVHVPPEFPPRHRVLVFTPEFGSKGSFDMESWGYIEPEDQVDIWAVSWQGWSDFSTMIEQVTRAVSTFADGANTVWFGQGFGAIVAYEVMKRFEDVPTPNKPVALVVSDCPAPHLVGVNYKPTQAAGFEDKLGAVGVSEVQRRLVSGDLLTMESYKFQHDGSKRGCVPIAACCHEGEKLVSQADVQAWEEYSKEGDDVFELVEVGDAEEFDTYCQGQGYAHAVDPSVLGTLTEKLTTYDRWITDAAHPDIGKTDGPYPTDVVDAIVVGAGISGLTQGRFLVESGASVIVLEKCDKIGGIWNFYANDYSRVNTSEIGYRVLDKDGKWARPNEDHTPRRDIFRDLHAIANEYLKDKIILRTEVVNAVQLSDGLWQLTVKNLRDGSEHVIKTKGVCFNTNRRIGERREVNHENQENFRGKICYGYANEVSGIDFWDKRVLIIGAGAFAFENVRTALEHGARHVTLLGRRDGTTSPKWIDMIAFQRPLDQYYNTNKSGNMISFEAWQNLYDEAGLQRPKCWEEGLLKPNGHTISVSDIAFIAGWHGMFTIKTGEVARIRDDGMGVTLKDGADIDCNIIIKCTGFHRTNVVEDITGCPKMYPNGLLAMNCYYGAEPLLDGGQFGSAKDKTEIDTESGFEEADLNSGIETLNSWHLNIQDCLPAANPFGSGQGGPTRQNSLYFAWLMENQHIQQALLKNMGKPPQNVSELWLSQIGAFQHLTTLRIIASLAKLNKGTDGMTTK